MFCLTVFFQASHLSELSLARTWTACRKHQSFPTKPNRLKSPIPGLIPVINTLTDKSGKRKLKSLRLHIITTKLLLTLSQIRPSSLDSCLTKSLSRLSLEDRHLPWLNRSRLLLRSWNKPKPSFGLPTPYDERSSEGEIFRVLLSLNWDVDYLL